MGRLAFGPTLARRGKPKFDNPDPEPRAHNTEVVESPQRRAKAGPDLGRRLPAVGSNTPGKGSPRELSPPWHRATSTPPREKSSSDGAKANSNDLRRIFWRRSVVEFQERYTRSVVNLNVGSSFGCTRILYGHLQCRRLQRDPVP